MSGRIRRSTAVVLATLAIAAGDSPAHATCPPMDAPCLAEETAGTGRSLVDEEIGPIDTPADDTIDPVVGDVLDRVNDLPGGGHVDPPDPIGGGDGDGDGTTPAGQEPRDSPSHAPGRGSAVEGRRAPGGPGLAGLSGPSIVVPEVVLPARQDRTFGDRFVAALPGAARSLVIVLALFGLAVAFVAIQDRLDRKDPRLALAPVESDMVEFA